MAVVAFLLVATFYAPSHMRNPFGPNHSGQDVGGWRAGTSIPSFVAGTVAASGYNGYYGWWVSIRIWSRWYVTFSHMLRATPLDVDDPVRIGTLVGQVGASGAYARGFHVHVGYGSGKYPWSRPTVNPIALIRVGTKPAAVVVTPIPAPKKGNDVIIIQHIDNKRTALVGEITFREISAAQLAVERRAWGGTYLQVTSAEWNAFAALRPAQEGATLTPEQLAQISAGVKVPPVDLSAVLDALRGLPAAVGQYVLNLFKGQWAK